VTCHGRGEKASILKKRGDPDCDLFVGHERRRSVTGASEHTNGKMAPGKNKERVSGKGGPPAYISDPELAMKHDWEGGNVIHSDQRWGRY